MKRVGRALFFRTGVNDLVRAEIDRHQQREKETRARLEQQIQELRKSTDASNKELRQLNRRYADLTDKYNAAMELLDRRHEQLGRVVDDVHGLKKEHLSGRLTTLEHARQDDQAERLQALTAQLEERFPVASLVSHLERVIERSPLEQDPYPHVVLNDVLPDALHSLLYEARPPEGFWRGGQIGRQNWTIGEDLGPLRTEAAWRFMDDVVASRVMTPVLARLFEDYLHAQLNARSAMKARTGKAPAAYERSGGRLMLRRPGYTFEPHLDPRRALLTALFYFGSPQDSHDHGTKLFRSNATVPEKHAGVYYPLREGASCDLAKTVPSRPNSMLVFASRIGLHGADIPPDAQPATLERYAYQFYIGKA
jgi:hypothetical protein